MQGVGRSNQDGTGRAGRNQRRSKRISGVERGTKRTILSRQDPGRLGARGRPDGRHGLGRPPAGGARRRVASPRIRRHEAGAAHVGPRATLWLWVLPFLFAVAVVDIVLNTPLESAWVSVFPFLAEPGSYSVDAIFGSQEILGRLEGAWWFFALFVIQAAFNTILGEEFLFRGVLLPRMEGVFGRGSWVANGVLFGFYHLHQPWSIPNAVVTGLLYTFPAYRYRSTWMAIILHSAQSVFFAFLVLGVVLGLA